MTHKLSGPKIFRDCLLFREFCLLGFFCFLFLDSEDLKSLGECLSDPKNFPKLRHLNLRFALLLMSDSFMGDLTILSNMM